MKFEETGVHKDLIPGWIRSQANRLIEALHHMEQGNQNQMNGFVEDRIKRMEQDLRKLRKFYFDN